jgi:NADH:ubiquinone oxidoreductase subunit 5 (subunit L)/multisubunit Na+/H+ antiporter MnhA subunit
MEGPTPVSALIHAATLVTAGVFLIIRCSFIFDFSQYVLFILLILGALTALFGASSACAQYDLKKVIAFSTTSQLGYMCFCCGLSSYNYSFFHLFNHAFFKSLLFLTAGALIHISLNNQDLRKFGGYLTLLPFCYIAILIGSLSLSGFPYLSGFYSKDLIIENSFIYFFFTSSFIFWISLLTAFLTSFYSFRCVYLLFFTEGFVYKLSLQYVSDVNVFIGLCLFTLILGSIFSGFIFNDLIGFGTLISNNSIYMHSINMPYSDSLFISFDFKVLPLFVSILGIVLAINFDKIFCSHLKLMRLNNLLFATNIRYSTIFNLNNNIFNI